MTSFAPGGVLKNSGGMRLIHETGFSPGGVLKETGSSAKAEREPVEDAKRGVEERLVANVENVQRQHRQR